MPSPPPARSGKWRLVALAVVLIGLYCAARFSPLGEHMTREAMQAAVEGAGAWGLLVFVALFAVGSLLQLPGWLFVAVACLAYGRLAGGALANVGALVAVTVTFLVVRSVGGTALAAVERPWVQRLLARVETRPIRTIAVLRLGLAVAPYLNYALALSRVRLRDYVLGSAAGLVVPIAVMTALLDWFLT